MRRRNLDKCVRTRRRRRSSSLILFFLHISSFRSNNLFNTFSFGEREREERPCFPIANLNFGQHDETTTPFRLAITTLAVQLGSTRRDKHPVEAHIPSFLLFSSCGIRDRPRHHRLLFLFPSPFLGITLPPPKWALEGRKEGRKD